MISQVMSGDRTHRTIEDIDEIVLNAAQMKAIASGDPLIMECATLEANGESRPIVLAFKKLFPPTFTVKFYGLYR